MCLNVDVVDVDVDGSVGRAVRRSKFLFCKRSLPFGRRLDQFSLLSLYFANEAKILNIGLD